MLALVVRTDIARLFGPHAFRRVLHLLLVENEAHIALLFEWRERKHDDQDANRTGQKNLRPADQPVVGAARVAQVCLICRSWSALAVMGENVLFGPTGDIKQGAGGQEIETGLCERHAAFALEPLVELLFQRVQIANVACSIFLLRVVSSGAPQSLVCCCFERSWPSSSLTRSLRPCRSV